MKNFTRILYLSLFAFVLNLPLFAQTVDSNAVDGQIYFQLKTVTSLKQQGINGIVNINNLAVIKGLKDTYAVTEVKRPFYKANDAELQRTYLLYFKDIQNVDSLMSALRKDKNVVYAEKAPLFRILYTPNDPDYSSNPIYKWYLDVIQAGKAWDIQKGNPNIKIAILDNAIDVSHPDLSNKIVVRIDLPHHPNKLWSGRMARTFRDLPAPLRIMV